MHKKKSKVEVVHSSSELTKAELDRMRAWMWKVFEDKLKSTEA